MAYRAVYRHNMMEKTGFRVEELKFWTFVFQFLGLVCTALHFLIISFIFQTEFPNNVDIDLDEILDIEDENQRKKFIRVSNLILNCIFCLFTMGMGVPIFQFILKMSFCL